MFIKLNHFKWYCTIVHNGLKIIILCFIRVDLPGHDGNDL